MKKLIGIFIFICWFFINKAQEPFWSAGFYGFFDNREYVNDYTQAQTMFGSSISLQGGISFNHIHSIAAGTNLLYEFGNTNNTIPHFTLYYSLEKDWIDFAIGAFPRYEIINHPRVLLSDTLNYYRPNVEGMYINFKRNWGNHSFWIDWTSRQTNTNRETFLIGGEGNLRQGIFIYQHHLLMYHYARPAIPIPGDHLRDNGGLIATLGIDISRKTVFDSLVIRSGGVFSADRLRNVYDFKFPLGFMVKGNITYKIIGLRVLYYTGDSQDLMLGDRLYLAGHYARLDGLLMPFQNPAIDAEIKFSIHFINGITDMSQSFTLRVYLDKIRFKNSAPKTP